MILALLGLIPTLAPLFLSFLTKKTEEGTERERIQAQLLLEAVKVRQLSNASDNEYFSLRISKAMFFFSVSLYVSMVFVASALGIDPKDFAVKRIPEAFDYIPYSVVAYWTLRIFK